MLWSKFLWEQHLTWNSICGIVCLLYLRGERSWFFLVSLSGKPTWAWRGEAVVQCFILSLNFYEDCFLKRWTSWKPWHSGLSFLGTKDRFLVWFKIYSERDDTKCSAKQDERHPSLCSNSFSVFVSNTWLPSTRHLFTSPSPIKQVTICVSICNGCHVCVLCLELCLDTVVWQLLVNY